jgi:cytoplasmic tRNA 2-thiolation protein 2
MCSIGEDDFGDEGGLHSMIKDEISPESEEILCKKCNVEKNVIKLSFREAMCMSCFLTYVRHKFRACLGATKIIRSGSTVLLNFSGDSSSVCLLDMIKFGYEVESHKRLRFSIKVVFMDENCVYGETVEKRMEKFQAVMRIFNQFQGPFTCHYSSIANAGRLYEAQNVTPDDIKSLTNDEDKFLKTFNSISSLTSKQDFLAIVKNDNLRKIAESLECQYIFAPDVSISLAKRLISSMALGRGASAAFDVGFCDDRLETVRIIRPLKDISPIEILRVCKI